MVDILQTTSTITFIFVGIKCILIKISLKFVPKDSMDNEVSIGSGNDLAPNRRQAITWTNGDPVHFVKPNWANNWRRNAHWGFVMYNQIHNTTHEYI